MGKKIESAEKKSPPPLANRDIVLLLLAAVLLICGLIDMFLNWFGRFLHWIFILGFVAVSGFAYYRRSRCR
jgi:hypothetical protein